MPTERPIIYNVINCPYFRGENDVRFWFQTYIFFQFEWGNSTQTMTEQGIKHPGLKRLINACLFKICIGFVVAFCFFCHYMDGNLLLAVTVWKKNRTLLINNQRGNWKLVQSASFFFAFYSSFVTLVS